MKIALINFGSGNLKLHWDAGVNASLFKTAIITKIPFIFYAENGEVQFGRNLKANGLTVYHKNLINVLNYI